MLTHFRSIIANYVNRHKARLALREESNAIKELIIELCREHPNAPPMASTMCLFYDGTKGQSLRDTTLRVGKFMIGVHWGFNESDSAMAWVATHKGELAIFDSARSAQERFLEIGPWQTELCPTLQSELDRIRTTNTTKDDIKARRNAEILDAARKL